MGKRTNTETNFMACDCVAGTTVSMIRGIDSRSWMPIMMERHYQSQHLTPPRTPPGEDTSTFVDNLLL